MKGKECYFGATIINTREVLSVCDYFGDCEIEIHDAEVAGDENSPEIVGITITPADEVKNEIFVHKKDCLQIATFLLGIHTEYANKVNAFDVKAHLDEINQKAKEA